MLHKDGTRPLCEREVRERKRLTRFSPGLSKNVFVLLVGRMPEPMA